MSHDSVNDVDRCRVFNTCIIPALRDGRIFDYVLGNRTCVLFKYDFSTDAFEFKGIFNFKGLKHQFKKYDKKPMFKTLIKQLKITKKNIGDHLYICMFNYSPTGVFCPSLYKFTKETMINFNIDMRPSKELTTTAHNDQFTNKVLKQMIEWDELAYNTDVLDNITNNDLILIIFNKNNNSHKRGTCDIHSYMKSCHHLVIATDMLKLIELEHKKGNLIIITVMNYLYSYFLLVHYIKIAPYKYGFLFISSPNDNSLNL